MPLLEVRHLQKRYGDHLAVEDVSFALDGGEVFGLLGPNGAGKSTTMMMIAGLLPITRGEVLLDGRPFRPTSPADRRALGVVPQDLAVYPELNAWENLRFFGRLYGLRGKILEQRCEEVLAQVGLTDAAARKSGEYSGGMKRRLNFAIALLHQPRILILDEPTVGVDPQSRAHLLECVREVAAAGVGVIYASHYMEEVQSMCQRVAIIDHGKMLAYDSITELLKGMSADVHVALSAGHMNGELHGLASILTNDDGQQTIVVPGDGDDKAHRLREVLEKIEAAGATVERIETQQTNLERLFLQLTGTKLRD
ncbi:MAG TPA: ABC transporter ATP-binding protein [Planctomycetaceae bacterium]|nr:ABC transporter ATP-binding protein [Planctomycetaceae bacterium]